MTKITNFIKVTLSVFLLFLQSQYSVSLSSVQFNLKRIPSKDPQSANKQLIRQSQKLAQMLLNNKFIKSTQQLNRIEYKIDNYLDFQYSGTLLIGTSQQPLDFIFDTGSNQLWLPASPCQGCAGDNFYQPKNSSKYRKLSNTVQTITYGKGQVYGYQSQDQVWFGDQAVDEMPLLTVFKEQDFEGNQTDGILGLGPYEGGQKDEPPFLLDILRDNNIIDKRIISFKYRFSSQQEVVINNRTKSRLIFGQPDLSLISEGDSHIQVPLENKGILYFVELKSTSYSEISLGNQPLPALIDTGTSLIIAPKDDYSVLAQALKHKYRSKIQLIQGMLTMFCSDVDKNDSMIFNIGGNDVKINSDKMWMSIEGYFGQKLCMLTISPSQYNFWILGDAFIRDFYVVLDYDQGLVQMHGNFGLNIDMNDPNDGQEEEKQGEEKQEENYGKSSDKFNDPVKNEVDDNDDYGLAISFCLGFLVGLVLIGCCYGCNLYCKKRRLHNNLDRQHQLQDQQQKDMLIVSGFNGV